MTKCSYCNGTVEEKDSSIIYGTSYGKVWICENYPKCDTYGMYKKQCLKLLSMLKP